MSQRLVTLRQMQLGVGVVTALSLGITVPGMADCPDSTLPPVALAPEIQMSEMGEKAYDLALVSNWVEVQRIANQIDSLGAKLPFNQNGIRNRFGLFKAIFHFENALAARDKWETAWAANRITLFATRLARFLPRRIPVEVGLLNVYGRELQVAGARHDEVAAHKAVGSLHANWQQIRPRLLKISEASPIAQTFDKVLQRAGGAPNAEKMGGQATLILDQVDNVREIFSR